MKFKYILPLSLFALSFSACTDDEEGLGASVQPAGDLLSAFSNRIDVTSKSILVDSVLYKADYLYLGQYTDTYFGTTQCDFISQIDARLNGIFVPDTTLYNNSNDTTAFIDPNKLGIKVTSLSQIDPNYGRITAITDPTDVKIDSAYFLIRFDGDDGVIGDTNALQAIDVYALNSSLPTYQKHFSNINPADYCDKSMKLGSLAYQTANRKMTKYSSKGDKEVPRILEVPIDLDYAQNILSAYMKDSGIKYQSQFNEKFPGLYVAHSFNEGAIVRITTCFLRLYYHYQGKIHTTYNGNDTIVDSKSLGRANPLVKSISIACDKSVERVNVFNHPNKSSLQTLASSSDFTYVSSPSGLYTAVDVDYSVIKDSILKNSGTDASKISVNSALLKMKAANLNWPTKLKKTPNQYMMLINRDSIADFFYWNKTPDGLFSFSASLDTSDYSYSFDLSRAVQCRLRDAKNADEMLKNLVVIPVYVTSSGERYYYHQQLWPTGARFYKSSSTEEKFRPCIDLVYTRRE